MHTKRGDGSRGDAEGRRTKELHPEESLPDLHVEELWSIEAERRWQEIAGFVISTEALFSVWRDQVIGLSARYGIAASALVAADLHQKLHRIGLVSFSWGEANNSNIAHGGGAGAGRVSMQDFHFTMKVNKASPKLFLPGLVRHTLRHKVLRTARF